jgi:2-iminobutanoate/2-iminopropanoate deaminase
MKKQIISPNAPAAIGPYSQAVYADGTLFISGQLPIDPATGAFPEGGIAEQTRQSLQNVKSILAEAGMTEQNVVKTTVFLQDMADFSAMNAVYTEFFAGCIYPARSCFQVAKLPKDALVEIEVIAK